MQTPKFEREYSNGSPTEGLWSSLLDGLDLKFGRALGKLPGIAKWVEKIKGFEWEGHEFQRGILEDQSRRIAILKGAQVGMTFAVILKVVFGILNGTYRSGVLYLFPSLSDVSDFSKVRFTPLFSENPQISNYISNVDAVGVKKLGSCPLYFRGARVTSKIEGLKESSSQLKSISSDLNIYDEIDEMNPSMISLSLERLAHSKVKGEIYLSTPSIPDFGIDKLYKESDQKVWMIKCAKCNTETSLELNFPNILEELPDGRVLRVCRKCRQEIHPKNGRWVAQYPEKTKDLSAYWLSQLNSIFVDPKDILKAYLDPPYGNLQETFNSKLACPYISAENRLDSSSIYACCGQEPMQIRDIGPTAMGVDVGNFLHTTIAFKPRDKVLQICYMGRVSSFNDLHDLGKRFGVQSCVIDLKPEIRKVREFIENEHYRIFACDYQESQRGYPAWDEKNRVVTINRTEACDAVIDLIQSPGKLILPRRCSELEEYAKEMTSIAKVLEEDELGSRVYRYRKLGHDDYFHSTVYLWLAAQNIPVSSHSSHQDVQKQTHAEGLDYDPFSL